MIDKLTFLKPSKDNLGLYVPLGVLFFLLAILDLISNSFFNKNITSFLPEYKAPDISGIKKLIPLEQLFKYGQYLIKICLDGYQIEPKNPVYLWSKMLLIY